MPTLLIVIPALNEETSIRSIIERCLNASTRIQSETELDKVEITVVSDGSTDKTVDIATEYTDKIKLIIFNQNKGYGAAIKEAFAQSKAEYVSFLDADGTCDPEFFLKLYKTIKMHNADIVLGCRLNSKSKMPLTRIIGNKLFAILLTTLSNRVVRDVASGMRIIRRDCLLKLYPLPNGLEFTPAMSAKSLLSNSIKIEDIDMPYRERSGESKLRVIKDGIRFLKVILKACLLYRPSRIFGIASITSIILAFLLLVKPIMDLVTTFSLVDWLIYRAMVGTLFSICAVIFAAASVLSQKFVDIVLPIPPPGSNIVRRCLEIIFSKRSWFISVFLVVVAGVVVFPVAQDLILTGHTSRHWIRFVLMTLCLLTATIITTTSMLLYTLDIICEKLNYIESLKPENSTLSNSNES